MDSITALILACSLHFDDRLVQAFVSKVSEANPYFVGDLATVTSYEKAKSIPEAMHLVEEITRHGGRPAIGLMAVPVAWAPRYGRSAADLFDTCTNIAIATDAMATYDAACSGKRTARVRKTAKPRGRRLAATNASRLCILRHFDTDLGVRGYPEGVLSELAKLAARPLDPNADPPPASSRAFPNNTDEADSGDPADWSSPRLYFLPPPVSSPSTVAPTVPAPAELPRVTAQPALPSRPTLRVAR